MIDYNKALAAAREALEAVATETTRPLHDEAAWVARMVVAVNTLGDLLAAIDAQKPAAWVDAESLESVSHRGHVGAVLCRDQRPGDVAVFAAPPAAVPEGYALVPVEPTREMIVAGKYTLKGAVNEPEGEQARCVYFQMLAAAKGVGNG